MDFKLQENRSLNRIKAKSRPVAVVLGMGQNGLATIRSLGRSGMPVIGIDRNLDQYTARTRYCRKVLCPDFKRGKGLIPTLLKLGRTLSEKGILFPSGDYSLNLISEYREALEPYYRFTFPSREVVDLTLNKKKFYLFAQENGFLIPKTFFPSQCAEVQHASKEMNFPCIIKPYQPDQKWRELFPDQKLYRADDRKTLVEYYDKLSEKHKDILIQECIPGGDKRLAFSLAYLDGGGRSLGLFTGRKMRQYPPRYGTSSMVESQWNSWVAETSIRLFQAMNYSGYGSVEFIWDQRDKAYKIIEVSSRTWFPHGISSACGMNLVLTAYCDQAGIPAPYSNGFRQGVKWIHEDRDLRSSLSYLKSGEISVAQWVKSYAGARTYAISAWDDPGPAFVMGLQGLRAIIRHTINTG